MEASKQSEGLITMEVSNEHQGYGERIILIEFVELYQLFQLKALDKSILGAYCL